MSSRTKAKLVLILCLSLIGPAPAAEEPSGDPGPLTLRIVCEEGQDTVHRPNSRSSGALTIRVNDELDRPVSGVTVSLLMPADGPAGIFPSGLSTEILTTGSDGRISVRGIRWGPTAGDVRIRVTAMKGRVRAGSVVTQRLEAAEAEEQSLPAGGTQSVSKPKGKWIALALIAAGAAAGGLALGLAGGGTPVAGTPPPAVGGQTQGVQVGAPTITIGKP